jgi:putative membrane protein
MKRSDIRRALVAIVLSAGSVSLLAQSNREPSPSTAPTAQQPPMTSPSGVSDAHTFINDMTIGGMAEVQLGNLAAERATNSEVRSFGRMMVKDHSQAGEKLKEVAGKLNIQPPAQLDQKHKDLIERLSKLQGAEFDKQYMDAMVQGHEEVAGKLAARVSRTASQPVGTAGGGSGDPLNEWVAQTLPTVRQHLDSARELHKKVAP